jgi:enolase-phosphatase E1
MIKFSGELLLLDVEGTIAPLSYVHDVLFPYARERVFLFLQRRGTDQSVLEASRLIAPEIRRDDACALNPDSVIRVAEQARDLMDQDSKQTGLKQLQGLIWKEGFEQGELKSIVFADVPPALAAWAGRGKKARIFSSGSVQAQKLFFRHTTQGDLGQYLSGYHDTTTGPKRVATSYAAIVAASGFAPVDVLYISDVTAELDAAREAGCATALAVRPGNPPSLPHSHPVLGSLAEIDST